MQHNDGFKNILVVNSLSKRSSAPGLRSGFIAGDKEILKEYGRYRTYVGATNGIPNQLASAEAWSDDEHAEQFRLLYRHSMSMSRDIIGIKNDTTFYLYLEVNDDLEYTKELYRRSYVKVLPGRFLGRNGVGKNYVRVALVESLMWNRYALERIHELLKEKF
jgi:aspartate/methionine/tyrosine aminotransferase